MCAFPQLDTIEEGQAIARQIWRRWDAEKSNHQSDVGPQDQAPNYSSANEDSGSDTESDTGATVDSESTELYDLETLMDSDNELPDLDELRAELAPRSWLTMSNMNIDNVNIPDNYSPRSPRYSPTSPVHSPSPIQIDSENESEHGFTPPNNNNDPIITRAVDMFDPTNTDSDQELDEEVATINLIGDYINRGKIPIKMHGVYIFPQATNLHGLTWEEFPDEPCVDHCIIPSKTDKSFAKFYLTHSLCLKHKSSLASMGPWLYLSNRVSTLPKLHKSPQIAQFITLLHQQLRGDQRILEFLIACHLVENLGTFTFLIRADVYMKNKPLECNTFLQTYNVDDHMAFGDRTHYYIHRDFVDRVFDFHVQN